MSDLERNVAHERAVTASAATITIPPRVVSGDALQRHAEARTAPGPIQRALDRDLLLDAEEELADLRNYVCWQVLVLDLAGDHTAAARAARLELLAALHLVCDAYGRLQAARHLLRRT